MPTKKKRGRIKAPEIQAPQTRSEAEAKLAELGSLQRQIDAIEKRMNDRLAKIKEEYETQAAPLNEQVDLAFRSVQAWAEAHKGELLEGGRKSAKLGTGELGWRTSPKSVRVSGVEAVIEALHRLKLERFLRLKEEVNKEAILNDPEAVQDVKGISITQKEEFWAKPFESQIERARKVG